MAILCAVIGYVALPAITLASAGFWLFAIFCIACIATSVALYMYFTDHEDYVFIPVLVPAVLLLVFAVLGIVSSNMFHSQKAKNVADIAVSEEGIQNAFPDLAASENRKEIPLVDLDTARMLGDKQLAGLKNASWYDVNDEYNLIVYQGKQYRLSIIDYGDFFKFRKARDFGLPGYVLVSVTPENGTVTQEAKVILLDEPIRFSPGAAFSKNLRRHLRSQYRTYIFDKSFLEIDEEGNPYWVTGILRPTAAVFGVKTVQSFILTDARTGESKEYQISEAPEWIDHIYSLDYLMKIAEWHYSYVNGYWNNCFSKTGVLRTSYAYAGSESSNTFATFFGYSSIIDQNGQVQFYTGLTAANNAESNLGWLTIDTSTGKMTQYDVVGAEESSAQSAVESLVQQYEYEATFPLPANIGGEPSYIMLLKGRSGLAQGYAICNMQNFAVAVQAETLDKAISAYMAKLTGEEMFEEPSIREDSADTQETETVTADAAIEAIYTAEIGGTTYYYFQFEGSLYRAPVTINQRMVTFKVGDYLRYVYHPVTNNEIAEIVKIDISPN